MLKAVADTIAHRGDVGLVITGITNTDELERAWSRLNERMNRIDASFSAGAGPAVIVQEMIPEGIEVFAGVSTDETFGPNISFGLGGVAVELLDDVALRALPLRTGDAAAMIDETRAVTLLEGFRGRPRADIAGLIGCIEALAGLAWAESDHLAEIDLNPILVRPEGQGYVVVDALIVPPKNPEPESHRFHVHALAPQWR